jgi:hypothetical protein
MYKCDDCIKEYETEHGLKIHCGRQLHSSKQLGIDNNINTIKNEIKQLEQQQTIIETQEKIIQTEQQPIIPISEDKKILNELEQIDNEIKESDKDIELDIDLKSEIIEPEQIQNDLGTKLQNEIKTSGKIKISALAKISDDYMKQFFGTKKNLFLWSKTELEQLDFFFELAYPNLDFLNPKFMLIGIIVIHYILVLWSFKPEFKQFMENMRIKKEQKLKEQQLLKDQTKGL